MSERATSILALAICLFSCAAQAANQSPSGPPQPPLLPGLTISDMPLREGGEDNTPDLAITNLFLNPQRKLSVTLVNLKDNVISLSRGSLKKVKIHVALGELQEEGAWSVLMTNPSGKRVEGNLIIRRP